MKGCADCNRAKRIGFWVLTKRREKGYTRDDLAILSGISKYTIRNLELASVEQPDAAKDLPPIHKTHPMTTPPEEVEKVLSS